MSTAWDRTRLVLAPWLIGDAMPAIGTALRGLGSSLIGGRSSQLPNIPGVDAADPVLSHLDGAIRWYDSNARRTMKWHFRLRTVQLLLAASIPFTQILLSGVPARAVAAGLAGVIAIGQGIDGLHRYGEHYVAWRATAQQLLRERFLFSVRSGPYVGMALVEARQKLASRVDAVEASENHEWQQQELATSQAADGKAPADEPPSLQAPTDK